MILVVVVFSWPPCARKSSARESSKGNNRLILLSVKRELQLQSELQSQLKGVAEWQAARQF